jgi:hypothetical protein
MTAALIRAHSLVFLMASTAPALAGLVGYWSFEEGGGPVIADSSGAGNNGVLVNATAGTWTDGRVAGTHALYLDGTTGDGSTHVVIANAPSLQATSALSCAAWVRVDDISRDAPIVAKEGPGQLSYWFGTFGAGSESAHPGCFGMLLDLDGSQPWSVYDRNQGYLTPGLWQHVASTWDGSTIRHYLNGVALTETASLTGPLHAGTGPLIIGANVPYNNTAFLGALDEVWVYDHALTPEEVRGLAGVFPRLVGHWTFDEGVGTMVADDSGLGHHGELVNPKPHTWAPGYASGALYFDGTTGAEATYVRIPDSPALRLAGGFSATAWVRCDDLERDAPILAKEGPDRLSYWFGMLGLGQGGAGPGNFGVLLSENGSHPWTLQDRDQGAVPLGEWVHLASTWDGATVRHYLRGEPLPDTRTFNGPIRSSDAFLAIGVNSLFTQAANATAFKGAIDDVALYNYALGPEEIRSQAGWVPFRITAVEREGQDVRLTWSCLPGRRYVIQTSPLVQDGSPVPFSDASEIIALPENYPNPTTSFLDRGALARSARLYYRVRLVP